MNNYVSALDLINLTNEIGNAIVHSEHAINQLKLNNNNYNFEILWRDILEIHFWDLEQPQQEAAKAVLEQLIKSVCIACEQSLIIDDDFISDCFGGCEQLEFDF
ncbi:hypothetical protein [Colwellia piezophila]|uniref:hypothetical protein n=1 Tax=Colwellia piezophila TaxID=211668 RepID=UPI0003734CC2|nr:hypothetical protein [Colwellia piezophila]